MKKKYFSEVVCALKEAGHTVIEWEKRGRLIKMEISFYVLTTLVE